MKAYACGIEAALDVIGGKWKAWITWSLRSGPVRFGRLRRSIHGITEKMLIQQLRELEGDGVVHREAYPEIPPRVEYSLTEFGVSLIAALRPLCEWGAQHMERIAARRDGQMPPEPPPSPHRARRHAGGAGNGRENGA